jgi:hypothetical protein
MTSSTQLWTQRRSCSANNSNSPPVPPGWLCFIVGATRVQYHVPERFLTALEPHYDWTEYLNRLYGSPNGPYVSIEHIACPVFDALSAWPNGHLLPTEDAIKLQPYPEEWDRGTEDMPLVCGVVWGLHVLSYSIPIPTIQRKTLAYLFFIYTRERKVPGPERIAYIFAHVPEDAGILKLCVALYIKYHREGDAPVNQPEKVPGKKLVESVPGEEPGRLRHWHRDLGVYSSRFMSMLNMRRQQFELEWEEINASLELKLEHYCHHDGHEQCRCEDELNLFTQPPL